MMADTEGPGSLAKLFAALTLDTGAVSVRKVIYNGAATDLDGKRVHLSVYYIGPMSYEFHGPVSYEFHVSGRGKHIYQPRKLMDKGDMIPMFARHYGLSDIQLDRFFRSNPRDWPHPVASGNVCRFDDLTQ